MSPRLRAIVGVAIMSALLVLYFVFAGIRAVALLASADPVPVIMGAAMLVLPIWSVIGFLVYFGYSRRNSQLGKGIVEVHEAEIEDIAPHIPGVDAPNA